MMKSDVEDMNGTEVLTELKKENIEFEGKLKQQQKGKTAEKGGIHEG